MNKKLLLFYIFNYITLALFFSSCSDEFGKNNYTAYFGGEVVNPKNNYVVLLKNESVVDTLLLDKSNRFFKQFDSLAPGMYTFFHGPEYQYVYFEKNDSILVRLNPNDFDESVVFCGRGDEKNNFLMEMYLMNQNDHNQMYDVFEYDIKQFLHVIDSSLESKKKFYERRKEHIQWSSEFDQYAQNILMLHHFTKKEIFPSAHEIRTGISLKDSINRQYYAHRKLVDLNMEEMLNFSPYLRYLTSMMNNVAYYQSSENQEKNRMLQSNIHKLKIADTLFKSEMIRNRIMKRIANNYLLDDHDYDNNLQFLKFFTQINTDTEFINEYNTLASSIKKLEPGKFLPIQNFTTKRGQSVQSDQLFNNKSIIIFWSTNYMTHYHAVHKKIQDLLELHPDYNIYSINIDDDQTKWLNTIGQYPYQFVTSLHADNTESLAQEWIISRLQRTIVLNKNGSIKNAFLNIYQPTFQNEL